MKTILVIYDLMNPGQRWPAVDRLMESLGGRRALNTTWFLQTSMTPEQVFTAVRLVIDSNDKLFVGVVGAPAMWTNTLGNDWTSWLQRNLRLSA